MSDTMLDLKLKQEQNTVFKNVLEALSDVFSMAHFDFSGTGLKLKTTDTSHLAAVTFFLSAKAFSHYSIGEDFTMALSLTDMANALRSVKSNQIVTIKLLDDMLDTVTLMFESQEDGDIWEFDTRFLDNDMPFEVQEVPKSNYQAIVCMPSAKFTRFCNRLNIFGYKDPVVIISVHKGHVKFIVEGANGSSTIVCLQTQTVNKTKEPTLIEMKEEVSQRFELRYVNSSSKVSTVSDQVTIGLAPKLPAMFEYKIAEMGYVRYYITPLEGSDAE